MQDKVEWLNSNGLLKIVIGRVTKVENMNQAALTSRLLN